MIICKECKKEMKVIHNGTRCRWNGTHVYNGDLWKCPSCGTEVVNCNSNPCFDNDFKDTSNDIFMDDYDIKNLSYKNINLRRKK